MKGEKAMTHVLSIRISEDDLADLGKIAQINGWSIQDTARKGLETLIRAYSGYLNSNKKD